MHNEYVPEQWLPRQVIRFFQKTAVLISAIFKIAMGGRTR